MASTTFSQCLPITSIIVFLLAPRISPAGAQEREAIVNFYLYCDDRDDNSAEQTDEIYIVGTYSYPGGRGVIKAGPNDFRDGGPSERWRDYINVAHCKLQPGQTMSGQITVMDDDGNFQAVINGVNKAIGQIPADSKGVDLVRTVLAIVSSVSKGEDDRIAGFRFEVTNKGGKLTMKAEADGPEIAAEGATTRAAGSTRVTLYPFRITHGCNYHSAIWEGPPKTGD